MTDAELAILSIIAEAPVSGYDLQKIIDQRRLRAWTMIGVKSIYYVVDKLQGQGLIEPINGDARPSERQYRVTTAGTGVIQTAVMDMLSSPHTAPGTFDLGLANLPVLKTTQVHHALLNYRNALENRYTALSKQLQELEANDTVPFHIAAMFEHQLVLLHAEIEWLTDWFDRWQAQATADEDEEVAAFTSEKDLPRMQQLILPDDPDSFHKKETRTHQSLKPPANTGKTTRFNRPTERLPRLHPDQSEDSETS